MLLIKFYSLLIFFYFLGRSLFIIMKHIGKQNSYVDSLRIFNTDIRILYPLIGIIFLGNILFLGNFFLPLKSNFFFVITLLALLINFKEKDFSILNKNLFINFNLYFFIPVILFVSSSDIAFHYDAGFYHLNHQNWIRESKIIFGIVNIFWPLGLGSIYEYLSAFLWFDSSYILLHYINLIFIWTFFVFCFYHIFINKDEKFFKYSSIFILTYAFLDNFGLNGGRNGFLYIQGIGMQDSSVAVLFYLSSLFLVKRIKNIKYDYFEFITLSFFALFIFQTKVSGIIIFILVFVYLYKLVLLKEVTFKRLFFNLNPVIFLFFAWILKNYINTGCFIFPLSITCMNTFSWYIQDSTQIYESITTSFSQAYIFGDSLVEWSKLILSREIKRTVITNFSISFLSLILFRFLFFQNKKENKGLIITIVFFIFTNLIFLILYGPEERYAMGILMFIVASLGLGINKGRFNIQRVFYIIFLLALILFPRLDSYKSLNIIENRRIEIPAINYVEYSDKWVYPEIGDKCWVNLNCTIQKPQILIKKLNTYKFIYLK